MTKNEYLNELKTELSGLDQKEIVEIIRDQEEYIGDAVVSGRTESDVIASLGSLKDFAKEIRATRQIKAAHQETNLVPKINQVLKAIVAVCVLAPFNLIFILGPFLGFCGILIAAWAVAASLAVVGIAGMPVTFISGGASITLAVFMFFASISLIGLGILAVIGCYYFTQFFLKMTVSYLKWNINFITGEK